MPIKCIFFDCMETLVELRHMPELKDYAAWAYEGSEAGKLWSDFSEFFSDYVKARDTMNESLPKHKEYEMLERFEMISSIRMPDHEWEGAVSRKVGRALYENYWKRYCSECYVEPDVPYILKCLKWRQYKLFVVSNFMIMEGIENILKQNNLLGFFDSVITSISIGWRKPHREIYFKALEKAGVDAGSVLFVGDDRINDFEVPRMIGMNSVLFDRKNMHADVADRITDFYGLKSFLDAKGEM